MRPRVPSSARRAPGTANEADIDTYSAQAEETREILRRLKRVQCCGFHRPYLIVGIDWSHYIDGNEVTGFGNQLRCLLLLATASN